MSDREIASLSFSRFTRLRRCLLSGGRMSAFGGTGPPRAPVSRRQVVGDIFHRLMQALNDAQLNRAWDGPALRAEFNRVVEDARAEIATSAASAHLGDPRMWPELTHVYRGVSDACERRRLSRANSGLEVHAEEELRSKDGLLFGRLDAFFIDSNGIDVVDYKSGSILDGVEPKEAYVEQLYLYAYLVEQNYDVYPRSLALAGGDGAVIEVRPDRQRSRELANEMRLVLAQYNALVAAATPLEQLASPSTANCVFCDVKPACSAFWAALPCIEVGAWNHVVIGRQVSPVIRSRLGGSSIELAVERSTIRAGLLKVTRLFERRYPEIDFERSVGHRFVVTNLRQPSERNPCVAEATERSQVVPIEGRS